MTAMTALTSWRKTVPIMSACIAAALVVSACSSSKSDPSSNSSSTQSATSLPDTVNLVSIKDETGPNAIPGIATNKGSQLAVDEINSTHFLGNTQLHLDLKDTAGATKTAASETGAAIANSRYAAIVGPIASDQAVAVAPIAEKGSLPVVFTQSTSDGIVIGDYTFRATAPQTTFMDRTAAYLKAKNVKQVGLIYTSSNPANVQVATKTVPSFEDEYGFKVSSKQGITSNTIDFSAPVAKLLDSKPDAIGMFLVGPLFAPCAKALRQAGFKGVIFSLQAAGGGNLKPAGADGEGIVWATDFDAQMPETSSQKFVKLYSEKYNGDQPLNFAAEGYDAVWWIARAIKDQNSATREAIQKGLASVAKTGFDGAMGKLTFEGNDMRVAGMLVQWDGTKQVLVPSS